MFEERNLNYSQEQEQDARNVLEMFRILAIPELENLKKAREACQQAMELHSSAQDALRSAEDGITKRISFPWVLPDTGSYSWGLGWAKEVGFHGCALVLRFRAIRDAVYTSAPDSLFRQLKKYPDDLILFGRCLIIRHAGAPTKEEAERLLSRYFERDFKELQISGAG